MLQEINFGFNSRVKSMAPICAYIGEKFNKMNRSSYEHIVARSKGGATKDYNCLADSI